jgi:signal transduction histidine kinase
MWELFQRFRRGRNASAYPGSGLGLAIVRAVADLHGGSIRAESGAGGSRFELVLPIA